MNKIAFIGLGNMGGAIASGFINSGAVPAAHIYGYDAYAEGLKAFCARTGVTPCGSAEEAIAQADTVLIAVKPYVIEGVLKEIRPFIKGKTLLSIALGYDFARLSALVDADTRVQFIMPNTPAMVGSGVFLFEKAYSLEDGERGEIMEVFSKIGVVEEMPSHLMGIGGAISGCGPAFCAMVIEALADAGVKYGLPRPVAYKLASQTLAGTGKMQIETGMHPGVIKDGVCSPAGTTICGVEALERAGLRAAMLDAVQAVMEKKV